MCCIQFSLAVVVVVAAATTATTTITTTTNYYLGMVEICAKILQIMRNDFKDYACTLCAPFSALYYT